MRLYLLCLLLPLARAVDLPTLVTCLKHAEATSSESVDWGANNCNQDDGAALQGVVMDAVCAITLHKQIAGSGDYQGCTHMASQEVCQATSTKAHLRCKWDTDAGKCKWNRDSKNNVCVLPPEGHTDLPASVQNCAAIVSGECPAPWEVPGGCCLEEHMKYVGVLTSRPGFVCCNAPCTSLAAGHKDNTLVDLMGVVANVTTYTGVVTTGMRCGEQMGSTFCAPGMRSYFGQQQAGMGGLMDQQMQMSTMGLYAGHPVTGGHVSHAYAGQGDSRLMQAIMSGLGGGMGGYVDLDEDVEETGVDEISIDDFMDVLIDALNTDADVFESDRQITTDPWFGRKDFGLGPLGMKLDNPMDIFDDIYGNLNYGQQGMNVLGNQGMAGMFGTPQMASMFPGAPYGPYGTGFTNFNSSYNPMMGMMGAMGMPPQMGMMSQMGMMPQMGMMGMPGAQQMGYGAPSFYGSSSVLGYPQQPHGYGAPWQQQVGLYPSGYGSAQQPQYPPHQPDQYGSDYPPQQPAQYPPQQQPQYPPPQQQQPQYPPPQQQQPQYPPPQQQQSQYPLQQQPAQYPPPQQQPQYPPPQQQQPQYPPPQQQQPQYPPPQQQQPQYPSPQQPAAAA